MPQFSRLRIIKSKWVLLIGVVILAGLILIGVNTYQSRPEARVYTMGWENDPPFQAPGTEGQPTGLAIELVREAAKRRGIQLLWVEAKCSSEIALREKRVDLWPLMTITPARKKFLHLTQPYLEAEQCFLVRSDSRYEYLKDLAKARISYLDMPMNLRQIQSYVPGVELLARQSVEASLEDVCLQRADGAFLEEFTAISALLNGPLCSAQPLRLIPIPGGITRLGIGSTKENRAAADAIREEIGTMAEEGKVAQILLHWSYFSNRNLQSLDALLNARRHERWLIACVALFAALFFMTLWQAVRIQSATNRTRQVQSALRQAEEKIRLMADNLREMVLAYDMDRKLIYVNPAVETLTGYTPEELRQKDFICWVHPDDQSRMLGYWDGLFRGETVREAEYRLVTKHGQVKWAAANWGSILDETGRQVGVQGSERDITSRIKAEEEKTSLEAQLRESQKMEAFGQLAGGVAHDFNNLLTLINGYSDLLSEQLPEGDPRRDYVDEIQQAGMRAASLTRQLLTFSRRQIAKPKILDLNEVVGNMTKMFQRIIGEDITLEARFAPGGAVIFADPGMIEQVLMNLAVNSRDAMPKGGHLTITTAVVDVDANTARNRPSTSPGRYVRLSVSDSGNGIAPEHLPHIFEPFFTTKEVGKGTGLGLATVFGIVEQHRGWIDAESRPGAGTTISIHLPFHSEDGSVSGAVDSSHASSGGTESIFLVEDDPAVRELARRGLERLGYRVLEAVDGPSALELWPAHRREVDLLLTDMVMPRGMNGLELAERLRADKPELKVILATGHSDEAMGRELITNDAICLLRKPYLPSELGRVIRGILDLKTSREGSA
jgi:PAS domain S-box-containing protein